MAGLVIKGFPLNRGILGYTLGGYGIVGFLVAFFGSRAFAVVNPTVVVVQGEVHFHHFWYGLAMVAACGWLGITYNRPRLLRTYALIFGLGAGLIGDEVGLLLTFGDYQSGLTTDFFVGAVGFILLVPMFLQYKTFLRKDTTHEGWNERLVHVGISMVGVSTILFAFNSSSTLGGMLAGLGFIVILAAFEAAKAGIVAGFAAGSILAVGNFFLLYSTNAVTMLLGGETIPADLGITIEQLAFLLALATSILLLLVGLIGGAFLGVLFSRVRNRFMKNSSLTTKGLVYGLTLWAIISVYTLSQLDFGILIVSLSIILALVASLIYGYLLGRLLPKFRRKSGMNQAC